MPRIQGKQRTPDPKGKSHRREAYLDWAVIALFNNAVLLTIALIMPPLAILLPVSLVLGLGFAMGAITVLHNAGHHRYSQRYWPNMLAVQSAVPVGLWVAHWTLKHRIHHRLPAAYPDDAFTQAGGMLRLHPLAPHRPFHRFQHVYAWFMYPLAWAADMQSQLKYLATGEVSGLRSRPPASRRLGSFAIEKAAAAAVLLPYVLLAHGIRLLLFLCVATLFAGLLVGCVVAIGHINVGLEYAVMDSSGRDWTAYVVATTASFSTDGWFLPWLTGGLTHHLAHHLRPLATREELRGLHTRMAGQGEVRPGLRVVEFRTMRAALHGHGQALKRLGLLPSPSPVLPPDRGYAGSEAYSSPASA
jgi:linoleoyl-CoA desaturase